MAEGKKIIMISQPMNGLSDEEILKVRDQVTKELTEKGYQVMDTFFNDDFSNPDNLVKDGVRNIPVYFLSRSLERMSRCDAVYFGQGWKEARGCKIEHEVAEKYGLEIIEAE